jgi:hypothetical protein
LARKDFGSNDGFRLIAMARPSVPRDSLESDLPFIIRFSRLLRHEQYWTDRRLAVCHVSRKSPSRPYTSLALVEDWD